MKKILSFIILTMFLVSCASQKIIPVGRILEITSPTTAIDNYEISFDGIKDIRETNII